MCSILTIAPGLGLLCASPYNPCWHAPRALNPNNSCCQVVALCGDGGFMMNSQVLPHISRISPIYLPYGFMMSSQELPVTITPNHNPNLTPNPISKPLP